MKKRIIIAALSVAVLAVMATVSLAYYTTTWKSENIVSTGKIDLEVHQVTSTGEFSPNKTHIMPGDTVDKVVTVENTGNHPCFVKVQIEKRLSGETKNVDNCITINLNTVDWVDGGDGFYYYNKALEPGEITEQLFSAIYFEGAAIDNTFLTKMLLVNINAYAVQSENNGTNPVAASGWSKIDK